MPHDIQASPAAARPATQDLSRFDYNASAELFPSRIKKGRPTTRYRRFDTAAEAVRFAIEEIPAPALLGAYLEVDEKRFGTAEIHQLYESAAFPLQRSGASKD
jgi:hypothetical protein